MPPQRRRDRNARPCAAAAVPSCRNDRRMKKNDGHHTQRDMMIMSLSDDALACVFAGLPDTAAVVRCAATCRRWGRVVATRAALLSRSLPPLGRFFPDLAVGFFHQENDRPFASARRSTSPPPPCFVATDSGARILGRRQQRSSLLGVAEDDDGLLDYSRPVASRNGRLVLELRRDGRAADVLRLAVCNPMTRPNDVVLVPPLIPGKNALLRDYSCALITGHDFRPPRCHSFFRLLLAYNRLRGSTLLRRYSSDTGRWGPEVESDVQIPSSTLCGMGQAVVRLGVAFWTLKDGALGVRLDDDNEAAMDMHVVPYDAPFRSLTNLLMGVTPDNRLFVMFVGIRAGRKFARPKICMMAVLSYFEFTGEDIRTGRKGTLAEEERVLMPQMEMTHGDTAIKLRWFGEKSGLVLFTTGERSGHSGTFALNLREKVVEKVADGDGDSWRNLLGYEMDMAAYLASLPH